MLCAPKRDATSIQPDLMRTPRKWRRRQCTSRVVGYVSKYPNTHPAAAPESAQGRFGKQSNKKTKQLEEDEEATRDTEHDLKIGKTHGGKIGSSGENTNLAGLILAPIKDCQGWLALEPWVPLPQPKNWPELASKIRTRTYNKQRSWPESNIGQKTKRKSIPCSP